MELSSLTTADMDAMRTAALQTADCSTLRDIREVEVDMSLPQQERLLDYIRQIGNPYCYRHGKYTVKVSFTDTDATLEDRMRSYLRTKC